MSVGVVNVIVRLRVADVMVCIANFPMESPPFRGTTPGVMPLTVSSSHC